MAFSVPLAPLDFPGYVPDLEGNPLASGWLTFYAAGTTTPLATYADVNGVAANANPLQLDSSGLYTVFLQPTLYDIVVSAFDSSTPLVPGAELYTREGIGDPGQILYTGLGNALATGSLNQTSGYQVLSTDNLVTMASTGGPVPCVVQLPSAASRSAVDGGNGFPLTIKNLGVVQLAVTPDGADTIEVDNAVYTVPGAATPLFPSIVLISNGVSAWFIQASHGIG